MKSDRKPFLAVLVLLFASRISFAMDNWLGEFPSECKIYSDEFLIEKSNVFEVVVSKQGIAETRLSDVSFLEISERLVTYYVGRDIDQTKFKGKKIVLTRALFSNGATGGFEVFYCNGNLVVHHSSLGFSEYLERSALVVLLDELPKNSIAHVNVSE